MSVILKMFILPKEELKCK